MLPHFEPIHIEPKLNPVFANLFALDLKFKDNKEYPELEIIGFKIVENKIYLKSNLNEETMSQNIDAASLLCLIKLNIHNKTGKYFFNKEINLNYSGYVLELNIENDNITNIEFVYNII
jgi:hypothetical protein